MKPNLTVLVGAGASVPLGVPSTWKLTELVKTALKKPPNESDSKHHPTVEKLLGAAESYYGERLNFEHILDVLESADALSTGWKDGNAPTISEACLTKEADDLADVFDPLFLSECVMVLELAILEAATEASEDAPKHADWSAYRTFWRGLADEFNLTIVTLNYDTLVEQALGLDGHHQGFVAVDGESIGRLDPTSLHRQDTGHRLFHLHGSIQFGRREFGTDRNRFCDEDGPHELYCHPSPESARRTIWGSSSPRSQSGRTLEGSPIITGLHKPDKLLIEPLASYYVESANQLSRCDRLLVIGYGFADPHVNALLSRFTRTHGASRRVALVDKSYMVKEFGSTGRSEMFVMLQRWGEERYEIHPFTNPYPWESANGSTRFYWKGLLEAAQDEKDDILGFLKS